jgi:hypothetical protein
VRPGLPAGHDAILAAEIGGKEAPMRDEALARIAIVTEELMEDAAMQKLKLTPHRRLVGLRDALGQSLRRALNKAPSKAPSKGSPRKAARRNRPRCRTMPHDGSDRSDVIATKELR